MSSEIHTDSDFEKVLVRRGIGPLRPLFSITGDLGAFVAGGYARWCCSPLRRPAEAGDVDVWFTGKDEYEEFLRRFFSEFSDYEVVEDRQVVRLKWNGMELNFVSPFIKSPAMSVCCGSVEEIIDSFDFSVCQVALLDEKCGIASKRFLADEYGMVLRIENLRPLRYWKPVCKRIWKYLKRGYGF